MCLYNIISRFAVQFFFSIPILSPFWLFFFVRFKVFCLYVHIFGKCKIKKQKDDEKWKNALIFFPLQ